jgi:hypothetical protein
MQHKRFRQMILLDRNIFFLFFSFTVAQAAIKNEGKKTGLLRLQAHAV